MFDKVGLIFRTVWEFPRQLKLIFLLKFWRSLSENGINLVFIVYLTEHFGMKLDTSNLIYILWNVLGAAWAIPIGYFVDHASLKGNLLAGAFLNCAGKILTYADVWQPASLIGILILSNAGIEFIDKVLSVAVSRSIPKDREIERNTAFQVAYALENVGAAMSFFLSDYLLNYTAEGMQLVILFSSAIAIVFLLFGLLFVNPDVPVVTEAKRLDAELLGIVKDRTFWRLVAFSLALVGANVFWNYNSVVFPMYMKYEVGSNHYGNVESLNPIFAPILAFIVAMLWPQVEPYLMVKIGSFVFALAALPLVFYSTLKASMVYVLIMTVGEAIYYPKVELVEYNIAPVDQAGLYTTLTKIPVGGFRILGMLTNSWLLDTMCNENVRDQCNEMWIIATVVALSSVASLIALERFILRPPDPIIINANNPYGRVFIRSRVNRVRKLQCVATTRRLR